MISPVSSAILINSTFGVTIYTKFKFNILKLLLVLTDFAFFDTFIAPHKKRQKKKARQNEAYTNYIAKSNSKH
jgi:hypothetical protein